MLVFHSEKETPEFPFYGHIYATGNVFSGRRRTAERDGEVRADNQTEFVYVLGTAAEVPTPASSPS